jgi:hypothetical protein
MSKAEKDESPKTESAPGVHEPVDESDRLRNRQLGTVMKGQGPVDSAESKTFEDLIISKVVAAKNPSICSALVVADSLRNRERMASMEAIQKRNSSTQDDNSS